MDIQFKATHYEPTAELLELANRKIAALGEKLLGDKQETARAYVELDKAIGSHQSGKIWRAEINLDVGGTRFRAEATETLMEDAVSKAVNELSQELRRAHKKEVSMFRKGGAAVKSFLRGFGN